MWLDEPDEFDRVVAAPQSIDDFDDPVAAGEIFFRVARAQGVTEGNKRTPSCWPDGPSTTTN